MADEAAQRGSAVSTLAGDAGALGAQVRTPVTPAPSRAVSNLKPYEVPVPIPGQSARQGNRRPPSPARPSLLGLPAGQDGADSTDRARPRCQDLPELKVRQGSEDGTDGRDGQDGSPSAGWTWRYGGVSCSSRPADDFDQPPRDTSATPRTRTRARTPRTTPRHRCPGPRPSTPTAGSTAASETGERPCDS